MAAWKATDVALVGEAVWLPRSSWLANGTVEGDQRGVTNAGATTHRRGGVEGQERDVANDGATTQR